MGNPKPVKASPAIMIIGGREIWTSVPDKPQPQPQTLMPDGERFAHWPEH